MLLENLIGSTTKVKILRLFYEYPNRSFTTNEAIESAGIGAGYGLKCLNALERVGILSRMKVGREKRYKLDTDNECYSALDRLFSEEKRKYPKVSYMHRSIVADIAEKMNEENVVLFGSVAAGTATASSDIDLLIVSTRPAYVKETLRDIEDRSGVSIQPLVFSPEKLQELAKNKTRLLKSISKEHIFVRGDKNARELIERV